MNAFPNSDDRPPWEEGEEITEPPPNNDYPDSIKLWMVQKFLDGFKAGQIARMAQRRGFTSCKPMRVHEIIQQAVLRRWVVCQGPLVVENEKVLGDLFRTNAERQIHVVESGVPARNRPTVYAAAKVVYNEILRLKRDHGKEAVHLSMCAGWTMSWLAEQLAIMLEGAPKGTLPKEIVFHASSVGFSVDQVGTWPTSFFWRFQNIPGVSFVGLPGDPYVIDTEWERTISKPMIRPAFEAAESVDIVVSAMGAADEEHSELSRFTGSGSKMGQELGAYLDGAGLVGDLQYLTYGENGPIPRTKDKGLAWPMTLFTLDYLHDLAARDDKSVVLVAGPCSKCQKTRSSAILPLLEQPALAVWRHVILDGVTAQEIREMKEDEAQPLVIRCLYKRGSTDAAAAAASNEPSRKARIRPAAAPGSSTASE